MRLGLGLAHANVAASLRLARSFAEGEEACAPAGGAGQRPGELLARHVRHICRVAELGARGQVLQGR